ncbi:MAG: hypothetical protein JXJ04_15035 [Spirochaetales bacterium]|nr:hypothetical protein [Spirochaetales bacterium]
MNALDDAIHTSSDRIKRIKPHLFTFFRNACDALSSIVSLSPAFVNALEKLTLASEFLYIDIHLLFPLVCKRKEFIIFAELLYSVTRIHYEFGGVILSTYSGLSYPLRVVEEGIKSFVRSINRGMKVGIPVLAFCLSFQDPAVVRFFLKHMTFIARFSSGSMGDVLENIKKNLTLSWNIFSQWITRGTDLITSCRVDEGIRFLLTRSKESRWLLGIHNVVLDDLKTILKIYCASLAGKELVISGLDSSSFRFETPYTDGKTIFLPQEINFFDTPQLNERVFTVIAAQQAASLRLKTFEFDLKKITFSDELRDKYGTQLPGIMENVRKQFGQKAESIRERQDGELEVTFKGGRKLLVLNTDHEKFYYMFPTPGFARDLFILCENTRIEYSLSRLYPGLKEDFKLVKEYLFNNRPRVSLPGSDRQVQFIAAVECLIQYSLHGHYKGELGDVRLDAIIVELCRTFDMIKKETTSVHDSAYICFLLYNIFYAEFPIITYFTGSDMVEEFSSLFQPEIHPEAVLDVSPELLKNEESSFLPEEPREEKDDKKRSIDLTSLRSAENDENYIQELIVKGGLRIFRYPEYNITKNSYENNHCTLFERIPDYKENDYYHEVLKQYKPAYKKIKKRFLLMKPEETEISRRWESGDEIHMTDAFDYVVDLSRNTTPDDKIYFRKIKNRRDIAVAILVDTSSSTLESLGEKRIIDVEKEALCLLSSALSIIGDTFGIFSFFSMGRNRVFFNIIKDFHEEWHSAAQARLSSITGKASNRDGCSIRHAASRLLDMPHKTKLLILLSDGIPADMNYGTSTGGETNVYAIEDTRMAIIEARREGIIPYCITIDRFAKKYIPHLYGDVSYAIIDDVNQLPQKLSRLYIKLTK